MPPVGRGANTLQWVVAEQAAELERLQREVVRLRAAVIVRDTRLEQAHAPPWKMPARPSRLALPRRKEMARHIRMLAERVVSLRANACAGGCRSPCRMFLSPVPCYRRMRQLRRRTPHMPHTSRPTHWTKAWLRPTWDLPDRLHQP